jgi:hypothetical protein
MGQLPIDEYGFGRKKGLLASPDLKASGRTVCVRAHLSMSADRDLVTVSANTTERGAGSCDSLGFGPGFWIAAQGLAVLGAQESPTLNWSLPPAHDIGWP